MGQAPANVNKKKSTMKSQKKSLTRPYVARDFIEERGRKGFRRGMVTARNRARTPPSLLVTTRRIAYAKRKYHSGTIWGGVTIGLAGLKFTDSRK